VLIVNFNTEAQFWKKDKTEAEKQEEIKQEKANIRKMAEETLSRLYELQPGTQEVISRSAGYGIFSNFGLKIFSCRQLAVLV
jgi:isocitrate lyase